MNKYLGIVKIYEETMSGVNVKLLTKTYDEIENLQKWFELYPNFEQVILTNTPQLDSMFKTFRDMTPITKEELIMADEAKKLYRSLMND